MLWNIIPLITYHNTRVYRSTNAGSKPQQKRTACQDAKSGHDPVYASLSGGFKLMNAAKRPPRRHGIAAIPRGKARRNARYAARIGNGYPAVAVRYAFDFITRQSRDTNVARRVRAERTEPRRRGRRRRRQ